MGATPNHEEMEEPSTAYVHYAAVSKRILTDSYPVQFRYIYV